MLKFNIPEFKTEAYLIQDISELPSWFNNTNLYLDFETTSEDDDVASLNPWQSCKLLGIAILVDDAPFPYYIPLRHRRHQSLKNLPYDIIIEWLKKVIRGSKRWINHNVKYDAHVLKNEGVDFNIELIDTIVLCKLAPQQERFTYNLTDIMREWIYTDISTYEKRIHKALGKGEKDYGIVPIDFMAPYACVDVLSVREIYKQMIAMIPEECKPAVDTELAITPILFNIENNGMTVDMNKVMYDADNIPLVIAGCQYYVEKAFDFPNMRMHVNNDCELLFVHRFGLPVLERTEKDKKPSFSHDTLLAYGAMRPDLKSVIDIMVKYKELYKLWTSFTLPYRNLSVNGTIHPDYNQIVRTGRMSCRTPNMQQLSAVAKEYIKPSAPDRVIVDIDFSQIEFRLIAHFINATKILDEYARNPAADYHQLVADLCGIDRYPAKRVNFMLGYGGGRGKCVAVLSSVPSIIEGLVSKEAIERRANQVYEKYHQMVPTLKTTTWKASAIMRQRKYVRTILKRRRYLPFKAHYKAFNTVIQGSAADLFKAAAVRLYTALNSDTELIGLVHDSFVLDMPAEMVESEVPRLVKVVEELPEGVTLRVPIRADAKWSSKNWRSCG